MIYISDSSWLNQKCGNRAASAQRLIKRYAFDSGAILELKRIIAQSKWNSAWVVLVPEIFGCIFLSNDLTKNKK